jgi:hypothetical protein
VSPSVLANLWLDLVISRVFTRFSARIRAKGLPRFLKRLIQDHGSYVRAVAREAELRSKNTLLNFSDYIILRRDTIGVRPVFGMMEFALNIDLPDEVFEGEAFMRAYFAAIDMLALANVSMMNHMLVSVVYL